MQHRILRILSVIFTCCLLQCFHAQSQCIIEALAKDLQNPPPGFDDFLRSNSEGMMAYKKLVGNPQVRRDVDALKATSKLLKEHADYFFKDYPGHFEKILRNLVSQEVKVRCNGCSGRNFGIPKLDQIIDDMDWVLANFKDKNVSVHKLFTEMGTQGGYNVYKADGGAFMINAMRQQAAADASFVESIKKFEYKFLDDGSFEADLYRLVDDKMRLSEFKSLGESRWYNFSTDKQSVNQFMAYFTKKQKFEYFANASKLGGVDKAKELVRNQFVKLFKAKGPELFKLDRSFFQNIKYGDKTINIADAEELAKLCDEAGFANSSLFNFVNVIEIK